jgi:hypothetical protein
MRICNPGRCPGLLYFAPSGLLDRRPSGLFKQSQVFFFFGRAAQLSHLHCLMWASR